MCSYISLLLAMFANVSLAKVNQVAKPGVIMGRGNQHMSVWLPRAMVK